LLPLAAATDSDFWRALAFTGFFLNLFNLIPVVPFDGGRAMAAMAPWMWFVGFGAIVLLVFLWPNPILILIALLGGYETYRRWKQRKHGEEEALWGVVGVTQALNCNGRDEALARGPLLRRERRALWSLRGRHAGHRGDRALRIPRGEGVGRRDAAGLPEHDGRRGPARQPRTLGRPQEPARLGQPQQLALERQQPTLENIFLQYVAPPAEPGAIP